MKSSLPSADTPSVSSTKRRPTHAAGSFELRREQIDHGNEDDGVKSPGITNGRRGDRPPGQASRPARRGRPPPRARPAKPKSPRSSERSGRGTSGPPLIADPVMRLCHDLAVNRTMGKTFALVDMPVSGPAGVAGSGRRSSPEPVPARDRTDRPNVGSCVSPPVDRTPRGAGMIRKRRWIATENSDRWS